MKSTTYNQRGFSLIELMIVVSIIGILSAIAIPNFNRFQRKARQSEVKSMMSGIYTAEKAFRAEWETYYGNLASIGYSTDGQLRYNVGFEDDGGDPDLIALVTGPKTLAEPGVPGTGPLFTSSQLCNNGVYGLQCSTIPGVTPAAPAGALLPAKDVFTIGASGQIGGLLLDNWTMTHTKVIANTQDGVSGT
ncbi:prepilin-type N-terminal cleavage/methylation domain-containing protein [Bdellovibrionales bacterium]|nr:prepilin-type N-terminal cleavage/methylation domain-containing protein [Bdellovibrionales bacterium]